jgi:hypothetical protein
MIHKYAWKCPKCGREDAAVDAALNVVACKLLDSAPPMWSTTPPTEPGWYWMRNEWYDVEPFPAFFDGEWWTYRGSMVRHPPCAKEFWPVPIPEPPREEGGR